MENAEQVDILVVEDNDSERASIVAALQESIPDVQVVAVHDGTAALDFLFARGEWISRAGADGFSVLGQIRALEPHDALTLAPVVIFSDSQSTTNITKSYRCGANSYIMKPLSFPDFEAIVQTVGQYWISHNQPAP